MLNSNLPQVLLLWILRWLVLPQKEVKGLLLLMVGQDVAEVPLHGFQGDVRLDTFPIPFYLL